MATLAQCYGAAQHLEAQSVAHVRYVGLYYGDGDVPWDYGSWHWPEVGVELET